MNLLWEAYTTGKQTYVQLAAQLGCSVRTMQRRMDAVQVQLQPDFPAKASVLLDTTYFGRRLGVMVFKGSLSRRVLHRQYVTHETLALYRQGVAAIEKGGTRVQAIVCDGGRGIPKAFPDLPVQMCQFHQQQIVTRDLTRHPTLEAARALLKIADGMVKSTRQGLTLALDQWEAKWGCMLSQRHPARAAEGRAGAGAALRSARGKKPRRPPYLCPKIRGAYFSMRRNLPWLFTFEDYPELGIPNTTNGMDGGVFADLKNKLRNHNGLSLERKKRYIDAHLNAYNIAISNT